MTSIFISRALKTDSPFRQKLNGLDINIIDFSLIEFSAVPFWELPKVDCLFFYSKNGIKCFFEQWDQQQKLPFIATIGKGTASYLQENYGFEADWIGDGNPLTTAANFETIVKDKSVLFVQAQNSKESIQKLLEKKIKTLSLVVYTNEIKSNFELPLVNILVFTSPLNVKAYFDNYAYDSTQKIVCIGNSTASELEKNKIQNYTIAQQPNEINLAEACLSLIK